MYLSADQDSLGMGALFILGGMAIAVFWIIAIATIVHELRKVAVSAARIADDTAELRARTESIEQLLRARE
jgi:hypothetical protein